MNICELISFNISFILVKFDLILLFQFCFIYYYKSNQLFLGKNSCSTIPDICLFRNYYVWILLVKFTVLEDQWTLIFMEMFFHLALIE